MRIIMREKQVSEFEGYISLAAVSLIIIICSFFVFTNLKATLLYKKAISRKKPSFKIEERIYYRELDSAISKAIRISPGNADYYAKKADTRLKANDSGFQKELSIDKIGIEKLYIKAIKLNSVNFLYHLKLGWFYFRENRNIETENELRIAKSLYSTREEVDTYLGRYYLAVSEEYFRGSQEKEGFKNFLLAAYYIFNRRTGKYIFNMKSFEVLPHVSWWKMTRKRKKGEKQLHYTVTVDKYKLDFKEFGFPHQKIPLTIKIYISTDSDIKSVNLYKNYSVVGSFKRIEPTSEQDIYELDIKDFETNTYLDDLRIEIRPRIIIEKIEIVI
ncbi:MAG: hypothetical protein NG737_08040 [Omnitrophica bacterium]|nr:hypothetical protein [Candidatus Omnitrophota bacterium]